MNKTFLRFGALALAGMMSISSFAQQIDYDGVRYRVIDSEKNYVAVQSPADFKATSLTVQAQFTPNYGQPDRVTYTVTQIDDNAFQASSANQIFVNVANLTYIGSKAFASSTEKTIYFNGSLNTTNVQIGTYAFKNTSADVKNTLALTNNSTLDLTWVTEENVGEGAFAGVKLNNVSKIMLGENLENIPVSMFEGTESTSNDGQFICTLPVGSSLKSVGASAFKDSGLSAFGYEVGTYWLPKDLETVGDYAFAKTAIAPGNKLQFAKTLYSSSRIEEVGEYAFEGASWLDDECFGNLFGSFEGLNYNEGSFKGCGLTSVDLSASSINDVPAYAFQDNPITSVTLPVNCKTVGEYAFYATPANGQSTATIGNLNIPASVKEIKESAFNNRTARNVFIRGEKPFTITQTSLPTIAGDGHLWIPSVKGVLPAFQKKAEEEEEATPWENMIYYQNLASYTVGSISYTGIQNEGDLWYEAKSYEPVKKQDDNSLLIDDPHAEVDVTILDTFDREISHTWNDYTISGECDVVRVADNIFTTEAAKAQIKSITFQTSEIETVPMMNAMTKLTRVVLPAQITELPYKSENSSTTGVFQGDVALTDVNLAKTEVKELPANAFYGASALDEIDLDNITNIGKYAFSGCTSLENVELSENLQTVGEGAFYNSALTAVTIPATVTTIGNKAFNTKSLLQVNVSYDDASNIPGSANEAFYKETTKNAPRYNLYKAKLHVEILDREDYLAMKNWKLFFAANGVSVKVNGELLAANENDVFVLRDGVESVSISKAATVGVEYVRDFTSTAWQCWFVPFDFIVGKTEDVRFAKLYDTKQTENGTIIEYKELEEGETVHANMPYVVKPVASGEKTFTANSIYATEKNKITVSDVENIYTFTGTYTKKDGTDYETNPWYGLNAKKGNFALAEGEGAYINAYRFYMTKTVNDKNPYAAEPTVKFVVLGDEDATGISGVNAGEIAEGAMFDLQGRKISAPVKGQVYIQNGVKKLAR